MGRPKSNGPYTPLSATYYRDDSILEAGERAELLYVRCLAFLADAGSDGFITERQMQVAVGMGLTKVKARVERLTSVGLLEAIQGGFLVRSWLKWNKSAEEIGRHQKHDRERQALKKAEAAANSARNGDGIRTDSSDHFTTRQYTALQDTSLEEPLSLADAKDDKILIPDDWQPNQKHRDKAMSLNLDVDRESQRFVDHAHRDVRRLKNWNAGFTNWLRKQAEFAQQRYGRSVVPLRPSVKLSAAEQNLLEFQSLYGGEASGSETNPPALG